MPLISHGPRYFSVGFAFPGGGAFVVLALSLCQSELNLHEASLSIDPKRNECQAVGADFSDEAFRFVSLDEEAARARGVVARRVAREGIEGDERVGEDKVVPANRHKAALETHVSGLDRFDFVPEEGDTRLDRFEDFVVEPRALVVRESCHRIRLFRLYSITRTERINGEY